MWTKLLVLLFVFVRNSRGANPSYCLNQYEPWTFTPLAAWSADPMGLPRFRACPGAGICSSDVNSEGQISVWTNGEKATTFHTESVKWCSSPHLSIRQEWTLVCQTADLRLALIVNNDTTAYIQTNNGALETPMIVSPSVFPIFVSDTSNIVAVSTSSPRCGMHVIVNASFTYSKLFDCTPDVLNTSITPQFWQIFGRDSYITIDYTLKDTVLLLRRSDTAPIAHNMCLDATLYFGQWSGEKSVVHIVAYCKARLVLYHMNTKLYQKSWIVSYEGKWTACGQGRRTIACVGLLRSGFGILTLDLDNRGMLVHTREWLLDLIGQQVVRLIYTQAAVTFAPELNQLWVSPVILGERVGLLKLNMAECDNNKRPYMAEEMALYSLLPLSIAVLLFVVLFVVRFYASNWFREES